jgi:hypothetical protein
VPADAQEVKKAPVVRPGLSKEMSMKEHLGINVPQTPRYYPKAQIRQGTDRDRGTPCPMISP